MLAQVKRSCLELMGGCHACQAESCVALLNFTASLECFRLLWHVAFIVRSGFYLASFSQLPSLFLLKQCQLRVSLCVWGGGSCSTMFLIFSKNICWLKFADNERWMKQNHHWTSNAQCFSSSWTWQFVGGMSACRVIYHMKAGFWVKKNNRHESKSSLRGEPCCRFIIHHSAELMQYSHDN